MSLRCTGRLLSWPNGTIFCPQTVWGSCSQFLCCAIQNTESRLLSTLLESAKARPSFSRRTDVWSDIFSILLILVPVFVR